MAAAAEASLPPTTAILARVARSQKEAETTTLLGARLLPAAR
jgi:hypothetical protein